MDGIHNCTKETRRDFLLEPKRTQCRVPWYRIRLASRSKPMDAFWIVPCLPKVNAVMHSVK